MTKPLRMDTPGESVDEADERIMAAAARLFREKGFAATTVREIAAAAQMLPGSLHYRYASKDDVLVALMHRGVRRAIDAVRDATSVVDDAMERLRLGLRAHLELLCTGDDALYVLLFDWRSLPKGAKDGVERERAVYEAFWDELLSAAFAEGRARSTVDLELLRRFGFGAINWVATWYQPGGPRTPAQIADAFYAYLAFGLVREDARSAQIEALFQGLVAPGGGER